MQAKTKPARKPAPPKRRQCGTMSVHYRLIEAHPSFRQNLIDAERFVARRMMSGIAAKAGGPVTIPVVVHVVYNTAAENISDAQIKSQITALNRDYRAKNTDKKKTPAVWRGLVTDANIQFALATKGPDGKATTGITRTQTTKTSFGDDDSVKSSASGGADPWPSAKYLNLWVCSLGGGLLGYAQFPGGPAATDGVVILNTGVRHERHGEGAVQPRPHRDARDRPLAEPAPHLGRHAALRRHRLRRRHAERAAAELRQAEVSARDAARTVRTATCS